MFWFNRELLPQRIAHSLVLLVVILTSACSKERPTNEGYFPIDSLLDAQVRILVAGQAKLTKHTTLGDSASSVSMTPENDQKWRDELVIFYDLSIINKPINQGAYKVNETLLDSFRVKSFEARKELPVRYLKVYYEKAAGTIRRIEARYSESNVMYASQRYLTLTFHNVSGKSVLTSYTFDGGQKIVLGDTVRYQIHTEINTL